MTHLQVTTMADFLAEIEVAEVPVEEDHELLVAGAGVRILLTMTTCLGVVVEAPDLATGGPQTQEAVGAILATDGPQTQEAVAMIG